MSEHKEDWVAFIGTYTAFLVNRLNEILSMVNYGNYYSAVVNTYNFLMFADSEIKKHPSVEAFNSEYNDMLQKCMNVGGMNRGHTARNRADTLNKISHGIIQRHLSPIMDQIHSLGYFSKERASYSLEGQGATMFSYGRPRDE
jgi:hypothetical protein